VGGDQVTLHSTFAGGPAHRDVTIHRVNQRPVRYALVVGQLREWRTRGNPLFATRAQSADTDPVIQVPPERHLLRAKDLADARYWDALTVTDLARAARLSRAHFSHEFRRAFGQSPHAYLLTRRLERAAALLVTTDRSITDICLDVGLKSVGSFTTSFTRAFGTSPSQYRAAFPPASAYARVPSCIVRAYGRPRHRTFREDAAPAPAYLGVKDR
jgi:AraC-like DNA-binding protein